MNDPRIPDCPKCGSRRVHHFGEWGHEDRPEHAYFQCVACEYQWTDFQLSMELLGASPEATS